MVEKYFINVNGIVLAMKYKEVDGELIIGGHGRTQDTINTIMRDYFSCKGIKRVWTQANKIRMVAFCSSQRYAEGKKALHHAGIVLDARKTLERIMR